VAAEYDLRPTRLSPGATVRGDIMTTVVAHHDVKDQKHWLASPKREEVFGPLGVTNIRKFIDPQNPNRVAIVMDVADMDKVMAAMENDEMRAAMQYDGVIPESLVILVEA
jgi:hypothetical protein